TICGVVTLGPSCRSPGWAFGPRVVGVTFHLVLSCSNFCRHTSGAASLRLVRKLFRDGRDVITPLRIRLLLEQLLDAILERGGVGLLDRGNGLSNLVLESCLAQDPLSERRSDLLLNALA